MIPGPVRVVAASIAGGALAGSVVLTLTWATTPGAYWFVMAIVMVPYAAIGYLLAALLLLLLRRGTEPAQRRWVTGGIVLALAGLVLHLGLLAPDYLGTHASGKPDLVVMTSNLRVGHGDPERVVALARTQHVSLLVVEEVTPAERDRLRAAGLDALLPNTAGLPAPGAGGTMVFSSYGLGEGERLPTVHGSWKVRVLAPKPFWLFAVHTSQPTGKPAEWAQDWRAIGRAARATDGDRMIAGDFNATLDHRPVRDVLDQGFSDAARVANSGWQPTWSALFTIDHVLFSHGFDAISTVTAHVPGSDHRALVAELVRR